MGYHLITDPDLRARLDRATRYCVKNNKKSEFIIQELKNPTVLNNSKVKVIDTIGMQLEFLHMMGMSLEDAMTIYVEGIEKNHPEILNQNV